jgi:predicted nucleic acid-binding protein
MSQSLIGNKEMPDKVFIDTNLWIYLLLDDNPEYSSIVYTLLNENNNIYISTQVLNEIINVLYKKKGLKTDKIIKFLQIICNIANVNPLNIEDTFRALEIIKIYNFSTYDSLIIASAINSDCNIVFTEDLQNGQIIEDCLKIVNPFK